MCDLTSPPNHLEIEPWARIIESEREPLTAYLTSILRCPFLAEDALHDTFLRLSNSKSCVIMGIDNPTAYCYQTARNIAIDMVRKRTRENWQELDTTSPHCQVDSQANVEDSFVEQSLQQRITQAINSLSNRHKTVFSLYKRSDFKQKDIANICAISPTLVNFTLQEIIVACQKALAH
jgi:RNA polymerase sigma factor (sigma-70 family)